MLIPTITLIPATHADPVLRWIRDFAARTGRAPTGQEIRQVVDFTQPYPQTRALNSFSTLIDLVIKDKPKAPPIEKPPAPAVPRAMDVPPVPEAVKLDRSTRVDRIMADVQAAADTARQDKRSFALSQLRGIIERGLA